MGCLNIIDFKSARNKNESTYNGHGPIWSIHDQTQYTIKNESI